MRERGLLCFIAMLLIAADVASAQAVTRVPFTAIQIITDVETTGDGTRVTSPERRARIYYDSVGRTRTEPMEGDLQDGVVLIYDPVELCTYYLNSKTKTGKKGPVPALDPVRVGPKGPKETIESLGSAVMEGVAVDGTRTTTTWGTGRHKLVVTTESWHSKQLQIDVLFKRLDSRNEDTTFRLSNISLTEPDPSLFIPPADYAVTDLSKGFAH